MGGNNTSLCEKRCIQDSCLTPDPPQITGCPVKQSQILLDMNQTRWGLPGAISCHGESSPGGACQGTFSFHTFGLAGILQLVKSLLLDWWHNVLALL